MSAAQQTKIFGLNVGIDPKYVVVLLLAIAAGLYFWESHGDETPTTVPAQSLAPAASAVPERHIVRRRNRGVVQQDRGILQIRPVDATRGDIDPTLRIDLLQRLRDVPEPKPSRSLFEIGPSRVQPPPPTPAQIAQLNKRIMPTPLQPAMPAANVPPQVNIPLQYYGFVKPSEAGKGNRALFLDGDKIVTAAEGELIHNRYLVVEVTPGLAKVEDTQVKQSQNLQIVPEAQRQ